MIGTGIYRDSAGDLWTIVESDSRGSDIIYTLRNVNDPSEEYETSWAMLTDELSTGDMVYLGQ